MVLRLLISALCAVGAYASVFMYRKARLAALGLLGEPSIVQRPKARLFGVSNAGLGIFYYAAVSLVVWLLHGRSWMLLEAGAVAAAAASVVLAVSLVRNKLDCPYCWAAHAVNWAIVLLVPGLYV